MEKVFLANGFPKKLVETNLSTPRVSPTPHSDDDPQKSTTDEQRVLCLPYIRQLSEKIEKVCAPLGIKAVFKPTNTTRQSLLHVKKKIPQEKKSTRSPAMVVTRCI